MIEEFSKAFEINELPEAFESNKLPEAFESNELPKAFENNELPEAFENNDIELPKAIETNDPESATEKNFKNCPIAGESGSWSGTRGDSDWIPNKDFIPKNPLTNPDGLSMGDIESKFNFEKISFKEGEPDFSEFAKETVKIKDFTDNRISNFMQADEMAAEKRNCSPEEVESWRKENNYTWHECRDCTTMHKVPSEVHGNIPHSGGISAIKQS